MMAAAERHNDLEVVLQVAPDGHVFLEARVPLIDRKFHSDLHRPENLTVQMGSWRGELALVLSRLAPIAQLVPDEYHLLADEDPADSDAIRSAVSEALAGGLAGGITVDARGRVSGRLALAERIRDAVDLDALRVDYVAWFAAAGVLDVVARADWGLEDTVAELVGYAFEDLEETSWSEHLWDLDRYSAMSVDGAIKHGLVVGQDPASTCALILANVTDDRDRWWHTIDRGPE